MVGEVDEAADGHFVALLSLGQGADDDGVEVAAGAQEEAAVDDSASDFDEGIGRDEAEIAWHTL